MARKPKLIICPNHCGTIRVNRSQRKCPTCKTKLFYSEDYIVPNDIEDRNGFVWISSKSKWVPVRVYLGIMDDERDNQIK